MTESATRMEAAEVGLQAYEGYYSTNLPCEMGLSRAMGAPFESAIYLVEEATR